MEPQQNVRQICARIYIIGFAGSDERVEILRNGVGAFRGDYMRYQPRSILSVVDDARSTFSDDDADAELAMRVRFEREMKERTRPNLEVIVLQAESLDAIKRTHARYFRSVEEIAAELKPHAA